MGKKLQNFSFHKGGTPDKYKANKKLGDTA